MNEKMPSNANDQLAADHDSESLLNGTTIATLLDQYEVSVRLRNSYRRAIETGCWPFETVGELVRAGSTARAQLLKVQYLGNKSVDELLSLVEKYRSISGTEAVLPDGFVDIPFSDIITQTSVSVRLFNGYTTAVENGTWPYATTGDFYQAGTSARRALSKVKNLGAKSISELYGLVENLGLANPNISVACPRFCVHPPKLN